MLNRESILTRKLPQETVAVPEWGDGATVIVRALSAPEVLAVLKRIQADAERQAFHWIVAATFNSDGARIFNDEDAEAIEQSQQFTVVERLLETILRLNPQKDVAAKNSVTPPSDSSTA